MVSVPADLLGRIRSDEVNHYRHFLRYFKGLQKLQGPVGRTNLARVLHACLREMRDSDSDVALRHVHAHKGALFSHGTPNFAEVKQRADTHGHSQLPLHQAARMLLKPLALPPWAERLLPPMVRLGAWVMAA